MNASLQKLRQTLDSVNTDGSVVVMRKDLEEVVKLAETVGLDVSNLLERFDATAQGYQLRLRRQAAAIGELVGRIGTVETTLRELSKSDEIHPELIKCFGTIVGILRNGAKAE